MPYKSDISVEMVRRRLEYNPDTGVFLWSATSRLPGQAAGRVKETGPGRFHVYIYLDHEIPAARLAWAHHHGEWPSAKLSFIDGDSQNLRIDNLKMMNSLVDKYDHTDPEQRKAYLKEHRATFPKAWKNTHLMAKFGVSLTHYNEMHDAQGGKCAICDQPETATRHGVVKMLAVDHHHGTGRIRGLLCVACNTGIGKLLDSPAILRKAADYIESYADDT